MIFLPLAFGAVEEWAIFIFEFAVFLLFALHIGGRVRASKKNGVNETPSASKIPVWLVGLLVLFLVIAVLQVIPLPQSLLRAVSPETAEIYAGLKAGDFGELGMGSWDTLSLAPNLSVYELVKYIFVFLFGYLVFVYVRGRRTIEIFVLVMLLVGVFESFYGMIEFFGGTSRIFGFKNIYYSDSVTGTFINRNHLAGFLNMIFPLSVGYVLTKAQFFSMKKELSFKEKVLWFSQERLQKCVILGLVSVLIGMGIFFSRSRMGIFVFFLTVFVMAVVLSAAGKRNEERQGRRRRSGKIVRTVVLVVVLAVVFIGIRPIVERFSWTALETEIRPVLFKNTVELIKSYPLFGTGLATYVYAYTRFEQDYIPKVVDHAHNDYLEIVAEAGLIGGGALIVFAFGFAVYLFLSWLKRRDYFVRGVGLGCLMGIVSILLHSLTDFNLHITANAVYFVALYALAFSVLNYRQDYKVR